MHSHDNALPHSLTIIIFGATGDLTLHKLMPSLQRLFQHQRLPNHFDIIACGRRDISGEEYLEKAKAMFEEMDMQWGLEELEKLDIKTGF